MGEDQTLEKNLGAFGRKGAIGVLVFGQEG